MHIFFDVDHTLISSDNRLRPGVRGLFARLHGDGNYLYVWSGIGARQEVIDEHDLGEYVSGCYVKPLYQYRRMLAPLGIPVVPEFVVDDHPHLVAEFGGCQVLPFLRFDAADREMERVYEVVVARRR